MRACADYYYYLCRGDGEKGERPKPHIIIHIYYTHPHTVLWRCFINQRRGRLSPPNDDDCNDTRVYV